MKSAVANILLEKDILLESGTNEMEVLVFRVGGLTFGINVAKVREVLPTPKLTALPRAHSSIKGVFQLRNRVISCLSLIDHLSLERQPQGESCVILTEINHQQTAFLVDAVERIHRMNWKNVLGVPSVIGPQHASITSVALIENKMVSMLDFERILSQVNSHITSHEPVPNPLKIPREQIRLLLADDSATIREAVTQTLRDSGYTQVTTFDNGQAAWEAIAARFAAGQSLAGVADLLISDVEMPHMDGFHLCKRIKEHDVLRRLPVLLYSSIVTPDNYKKGQSVKADAQVAKPDLSKVVELVDELIGKSWTANQPVTNAAPVATVTPATAQSEPPTTFKHQTPSGAAAGLWQTFKNELSSRLSDIQSILAKAQGRPLVGEAVQSLFRDIHSIKGASMVVPCEPVTRVTHLLESHIEAARDARVPLETRVFSVYLEWLDAIVAGLEPIDKVLAQSLTLEALLAEQLCATV
ncbi:MAG: chemotaxis protein CheW [Planctomycetaceae bacterium]|nr:chemotaxis protein CheW [Planctomycetaceae bacterium]